MSSGHRHPSMDSSTNDLSSGIPKIKSSAPPAAEETKSKKRFAEDDGAEDREAKKAK